MKPGQIDKLVRLRKGRVEQAIRDLADLRNRREQMLGRLARARERFDILLLHYRETEAGLQSDDSRSLAEIAAINGDIDTSRQALFDGHNDIQAIEQDIAAIERRIIVARDLWRERERAHDRGSELSEQLKTREILAALAAEEFLDS